MKVLCFAGSLRQGSYNKKYVRVAHKILQTFAGVESEYLDLLDYPLPVYNGDIESKEFPQAARQLAAKVKDCDAVVISSPENNGAMAAALKNTIDWMSRVPGEDPWPGKWILLLGASPGALGAVRGLWHTRVPFEALNAIVYPTMSGLPRAHEAFAADGALKDSGAHERLNTLIGKFVEQIRK
ncbi:MAG: NAD(P)H-dependent oxidoreductase [Bdellovibrionales bacterium]|nr:NAD(P)H-dependent oxidoreductase [Bdellovibrionales bacterium]